MGTRVLYYTYHASFLDKKHEVHKALSCNDLRFSCGLVVKFSMLPESHKIELLKSPKFTSIHDLRLSST